MLFWIWLRPRYKIPEIFTIAPVLTSTSTVCRRNCGDASSLYGTKVCYKYYRKNRRFGLAWSRPRADRGLSQPTSVFRTTIGVCKILSRSVEIWQYTRAKILFLSKNRPWLSLCLGLAVNQEAETNRKTAVLIDVKTRAYVTWTHIARCLEPVQGCGGVLRLLASPAPPLNRRQTRS